MSEPPEGKLDHGHERGASASKPRRGSIDRDAQEMVIDSLRGQIQDLFSQVSELNNKLVKSYDRVSDLEDDLHVASANVRTSSLKISQLELERTQHLSALNTGLLVEKSHVTTELNRLMEKATEEAAQRGQAESARMAIEKDLDDLSATLFGQANSMVAEARYDKHLSERKVEEAERALKTAEEAVQLMQTQMQAMLAEREEAEKKTRDMEQVMGKGKWVQRRDSGVALPPLRLLNTHSPYQEYLSFIAHLRVLHPASPSSPAMSTLLQLPLLARLLTEDSEPTVRLDLAPSLNWLSRRSVLTAIYSGQLTIEPVSATTLFAEFSTYPTSTTIAGMNSTHDNISCALCGASIFAVSDSATNPTRPVNGHTSTWTPGSFFKKANSTGSLNGTQPSTPTHSTHRTSIGAYLNSQVFIFRLASLPTTSISSLPLPSLTKSTSQSNASPVPPSTYPSSSYNGSAVQSQSATQSNQPTTIYPLCMSGWCLNRLRTTCTLWAFVRTGIVDKVWEEELPLPPPPSNIQVDKNTSGEKPPIPPRKRGLWGIASAIGERAASWSGEESKEKAKKVLSTSVSTGINPLPAPPPHHPAQAPLPPRRLPPPLPPANAPLPVTTAAIKAPVPTPAAAAPPPLPRRSGARVATTNSPPPRSSMDDATNTSADVLPDSTPPTSTTIPDPDTVPPAITPRKSVDLPIAPLSPVRGTHLRSSSVARAQTPSNVALPESRPETPSVPSRTSSPAVALQAAGGPPPPIPRRAAARAKIVPPGGGSRPGTPSNAGSTAEAAAEAPAPAAHAQDQETSKNVEDEKPRPEEKPEEVKSSGQDESAVEVLAETPVEVENVASSDPSTGIDKLEVSPDRSTQPSPGSDLFVDAPTPGEEYADPITETVQESPAGELEAKQREQGTEDDDVDNATIIDVQTTTTATPLAHDSALPAIVTDELSEEPVHINGEDARETDEEAETAQAEQAELLEEERRLAKEKEEKYKIGYVGDATWEEKTWKELVRLREDMFWARVGGFRD